MMSKRPKTQFTGPGNLTKAAGLLGRVLWGITFVFAALYFGTFPNAHAALTFDRASGKNFNNAGAGYQGPDLLCDLECQKAQRQALLRFYYATGGATWTQNHGWVEGDITSHCGWYGVHCCTDEHTIVIKYITVEGVVVTYGNSAESFGEYCPVARGVAAITLSLNNLTGTLPEDVFLHFGDSLNYLDLHGNSIGGSIPNSIGALTALRELSLNSNSLGGSIPNSLGQLKSLIALNLGVNQLTNVVPAALRELENVKWLALDDNRLTGSVPFFLFGVRSIKIINLQSNLLSGNIADVSLAFVDIEIPYLLSGFNIEELILRKNRIEGSIPSTITSLPVTVMDLGENRFSGPIPPTIARSPFLRSLFLDNNQLTGTIPDGLQKWNLEHLDVSNNFLNGTIPNSVGETRTLRSLQLSNNTFSGQLPDNFYKMNRLETLDISSNELMMHKTLNNRMERLPEYLMFDVVGQFPQVDSFGRARNLNCPRPVGDKDYLSRRLGTGDLSSFKKVSVSPEYYGFQMCTCANEGGFEKQETVEGGIIRDIVCVKKFESNNAPPWSVILTPIILLGFMTPIALWTWFRYRVALARVQMNLKKRKGPPGNDREVTLVLTDVEGSTELWEWDTEIMAQAIDIHDRVMRSQLAKFFGYEITTEGDAFLVAFHEPIDALAWCLSLQFTLLGAHWPQELSEHRRASIETLRTLEAARELAEAKCGKTKNAAEGHAPLVQLNAYERSLLQRLERTSMRHQARISALRDMGVYFRGLRVRMGISTGIPDTMRVHKLTMRSEYFGEVVKRVQAVSDTPHGGEVVMDQETFTQINSRLEELGTMVHEAVVSSKGLNESSKRMNWLHKLFSGARIGPHQSMDSEVPPPEEDEVDRWMGRPSADFKQDRPFLPSETEAQEEAAEPIGKKRSRRRSSLSGALMIIDMGCHKLKGISQPNNLIQAIVPGLEERSRFFPSLDSAEQLSPGYFDAPATKSTPLIFNKSRSKISIPRVALVFCAIDGYSEMVAYDKLAAEEALTIYNDCVRRTLLSTNGYECQEQEGNYMIAFASAAAALEWCLLLQEVMMEIDWTYDVLKLPGTSEEHDASGMVVFRGPRVKMGVYEGVPTRAVPHSSTGRADYFGQFVNRAARFCHAAAQGGQVIAARDVMNNIISNWVKQDLSDANTPLCCSVVLDDQEPAPRSWRLSSAGNMKKRHRDSLQILEDAELVIDEKLGIAVPSAKGQGNLASGPLGEGLENPGDRFPASGVIRAPTFSGRSHRSLGGALPQLAPAHAPFKRRSSTFSSPFSVLLQKLRGSSSMGVTESGQSFASQVDSLHNSYDQSFLSTAVEEPRYMSSFSINSRIKAGRWVWTGGLEVECLGTYRFKGVTGTHRIVSVKSRRLTGRKFGPEIRKGKGEKVGCGSGMIYSIKLVGKKRGERSMSQQDTLGSNPSDNPEGRRRSFCTSETTKVRRASAADHSLTTNESGDLRKILSFPSFPGELAQVLAESPDGKSSPTNGGHIQLPKLPKNAFPPRALS